MLCKDTLLFNELKVLAASIGSTASDYFSSKILRIALIAASHPASWPAQTCKEPTDEIIYSRIVKTTTFPAIRRSISSTPIGLRPGFCREELNDRPGKLQVCVFDLRS